MIRITGYGVITEKPCDGKFGQFFSMHPLGKTMRWTKKWMPPFWWAWRALSPCKVWGRSHIARRL